MKSLFFFVWVCLPANEFGMTALAVKEAIKVKHEVASKAPEITSSSHPNKVFQPFVNNNKTEEDLHIAVNLNPPRIDAINLEQNMRERVISLSPIKDLIVTPSHVNVGIVEHGKTDSLSCQKTPSFSNAHDIGVADNEISKISSAENISEQLIEKRRAEEIEFFKNVIAYSNNLKVIKAQIISATQNPLFSRVLSSSVSEKLRGFFFDEKGNFKPIRDINKLKECAILLEPSLQESVGKEAYVTYLRQHSNDPAIKYLLERYKDNEIRESSTWRMIVTGIKNTFFEKENYYPDVPSEIIYTGKFLQELQILLNHCNNNNYEDALKRLESIAREAVSITDNNQKLIAIEQYNCLCAIFSELEKAQENSSDNLYPLLPSFHSKEEFIKVFLDNDITLVEAQATETTNAIQHTSIAFYKPENLLVSSPQKEISEKVVTEITIKNHPDDLARNDSGHLVSSQETTTSQDIIFQENLQKKISELPVILKEKALQSQVITPQGYRKIEELKMGDQLAYYDGKKGEWHFSRISFVDKAHFSKHIQICFDNQIICVAPHHEIYISFRNTRITAQQLVGNSELQQLVGPHLQEVKEVQEPLEIIRIRVEPHHDFYITNDSIQVHNPLTLSFATPFVREVVTILDATWETLGLAFETALQLIPTDSLICNFASPDAAAIALPFIKIYNAITSILGRGGVLPISGQDTMAELKAGAAKSLEGLIAKEENNRNILQERNSYQEYKQKLIELRQQFKTTRNDIALIGQSLAPYGRTLTQQALDTELSDFNGRLQPSAEQELKLTDKQRIELRHWRQKELEYYENQIENLQISLALHVNELIHQYHQAEENYRKSCERVRDLAIQCTRIDFRNINKIYEAIIISEKYCDSLKQKINDLKNIFNYYERSNADIFKRTSTLEKTIAYYKTLIIEREKEISKYVSHLVSLKPDLKALAYRCGINTQSIDEKVNLYLQAEKESQQSQAQKNIQQQKSTLKFAKEENKEQPPKAPEKEPKKTDEKVPVKTIEDIIKEATPGQETSGKTKQYEKPGGHEEALKDFESLKPTDVKDITNKDGNKVRLGILRDGRQVNVRIKSSEGRPTLEVYNPVNDKKIKIRYNLLNG